MPYITRTGTVQQRPGGMRVVWNFLLAIWLALYTFVMTMVSPQAHDTYLKQSIKKRDPPVGRSGGGGSRVTGLDGLGAGSDGKHLTPGCAGGG